VLSFTIGTGCCESTAPFLYEDFWPGPAAEVAGQERTTCDVPEGVSALRTRGPQELPEALRRARMR
jgi:hypothetical protein